MGGAIPAIMFKSSLEVYVKSFGYFVFWRELAEEACATLEESQQTAARESVEWIVPDPPEPRTVISRVIQALQDGGTKNRRHKLQRAKSGHTDVEYTVHMPVGDGKTFEPCGSVLWSRQRGLTFAGLEKGDHLRDEAERLYTQGLAALSKEDWLLKIREALTERWNALPARPNGVVYWIPADEQTQNQMFGVNAVLLECGPVELVVAPCLVADLACEIVRCGYVALLERIQKGSMSPDRQAITLDEELPRLACGQALVAASVEDLGEAADKIKALTILITKLQDIRTQLPDKPVHNKKTRRKTEKSEDAVLMDMATGDKIALDQPKVKMEIVLTGRGAPPKITKMAPAAAPEEFSKPEEPALPMPAIVAPSSCSMPSILESATPALPTIAPPVAPPAAPPLVQESLTLMAPDGRAVEIMPPGKNKFGDMFEYAISGVEDFSWSWCQEPTRGMDWCAFGGAVYTTKALF